MKPFDKKSTILVAEIFPNENFLFIRWNSTTSLSPHQKRNKKKRKLKFGTKIKYLKRRGIDYLITE